MKRANNFPNANQQLGKRGEDAAASYLRRLGWTVLDRNWRCAEGEIDIIAHDGAAHVVCEVKTRGSTVFGTPVEAISEVKARRLRKLALHWASTHGVRGDEVRVDVIGLVADGTGFSLEHLREVC